MTKQQKAREFGHKQAEWWVETNKQEELHGGKQFDLAWMLGQVWQRGFDAGQRHQIKLQKEKAK